jgi:hypothetical protein
MSKLLKDIDKLIIECQQIEEMSLHPSINNMVNNAKRHTKFSVERVKDSIGHLKNLRLKDAYRSAALATIPATLALHGLGVNPFEDPTIPGPGTILKHVYKMVGT